MLSRTYRFVALLGMGLGASLVNAIPKANYLIASPPETVTVTACGYQCASTVTVTDTLTETAPYFFTCEPSSSSVATGPLGSLTLSSSIIPPPPFTLSNTTSRLSPTTTSWATGPATSLAPSSSTEINIETSTPGVTVSPQLPSARTPSSSFTWAVNSTSSSSGLSSSFSYGTGTAGTSVTSARPPLSTSLWSNSTKPITRTVTRTVRSTGTDSSTAAEVTIPTIPSISIPPPPATITRSNSTTSSGPSYTVTTYTTVINTTVSSQLPGASSLSLSASVTTVQTTVVVTVTNTIPRSTGTGYTFTSGGTGVSSGFPSLWSSTSIRLSNSLSYGTTSTSTWLNTTSTASGVSTESTSRTKTPTTGATFRSDSKVPCATDTESVTRSYATPGTTVSSALPSLVTPTTTATSSTSSDEYGLPSSSSLGTTVGSAKPSLVSSSTSELDGGYGPGPLPGTTVSSALPSLVTSSISSISGAYGAYPSASEGATFEVTGTTVASALPSLVTPSASSTFLKPTTLETRKSDESTSTSASYPSYDYGHSLEGMDVGV